MPIKRHQQYACIQGLGHGSPLAAAECDCMEPSESAAHLV